MQKCANVSIEKGEGEVVGEKVNHAVIGVEERVLL